MDYSGLKSEIETGPLSGELAGLSDNDAASVLNDKRFLVVRERFINARTVLNECGPVAGAAILDKLEAAAAQSSPLRWALRFLAADGIDIGAASTREQVDALVLAGVLTLDEGEALKVMANTLVSRAEALGLGHVTYDDVHRARSM